jgi:hypothetical protein
MNTHDLLHQIVAILFLWALAGLGLATIGLYRTGSERWRGFWLMTGLWSLVNGAIAWYALVTPPPPPIRLAQILRLNAGLDILYLFAGILLMTRSRPQLRGFGLAILIQGTFLLAFDLTFWIRTLATLS